MKSKKLTPQAQTVVVAPEANEPEKAVVMPSPEPPNAASLTVGGGKTAENSQPASESTPPASEPKPSEEKKTKASKRTGKASKARKATTRPEPKKASRTDKPEGKDGGGSNESNADYPSARLMPFADTFLAVAPAKQRKQITVASRKTTVFVKHPDQSRQLATFFGCNEKKGTVSLFSPFLLDTDEGVYRDTLGLASVRASAEQLKTLASLILKRAGILTEGDGTK